MAKDADADRVRGEVGPGRPEYSRGLEAWGHWLRAGGGPPPRQREVALRHLPGEPLELLSREVGVELLRLEKVRDAALAGLEEALKAGGTPSRASWTTP